MVKWLSLARFRCDLCSEAAKDVIETWIHVANSADDFLSLVNTIVEKDFILSAGWCPSTAGSNASGSEDTCFAIARAVTASESIGAACLLIHARDEAANSFYVKNGYLIQSSVDDLPPFCR